MDATTAEEQENKSHTYPEWRNRMLQKCVASGRLPPANAGVCDLPQKIQRWWENEEEGEVKREKMLDEEVNERVSMTSDAEWEGWRGELAVKGPIRPGSPDLKAVQRGDSWTSDCTLSPNRTDFYGRRRTYREELRC